MTRILLDTDSMRHGAGVLRSTGGELTSIAVRLPSEGLGLMPPTVLAHVEFELGAASAGLLGQGARLEASGAALFLRAGMADAAGGDGGWLAGLGAGPAMLFDAVAAGRGAALFAGLVGGGAFVYDVLGELPNNPVGQLVEGGPGDVFNTVLTLGQMYAAKRGSMTSFHALGALGTVGSIVSDIDTLEHGPQSTTVGRVSAVAAKYGWHTLTDKVLGPGAHKQLNALTGGSWDHMLDAPIVIMEGVLTGNFEEGAERYMEALNSGQEGVAFQIIGKAGSWMGDRIGDVLYPIETEPSSGGGAW